MTDRTHDALDLLLGASDVPPLSPGFADRVIAEAQRSDRVARLAAPIAPRPRRFARRGVWATVAAVNLLLVSAVAAAFGTGAITGTRLIAAARHVVERIAPPVVHHPHHAVAHVRHPIRRMFGPQAVPVAVPLSPETFGGAMPPPRFHGRRLLRWEVHHADPVAKVALRQELRAERRAAQAAQPLRYRRHLERRRQRQEAIAAGFIPPHRGVFRRVDDGPAAYGDAAYGREDAIGRRQVRRERRWQRQMLRFRRGEPFSPDAP